MNVNLMYVYQLYYISYIYGLEYRYYRIMILEVWNLRRRIHCYTTTATWLPLYSFNPLSISCTHFAPCKRIIRGERYNCMAI